MEEDSLEAAPSIEKTLDPSPKTLGDPISRNLAEHCSKLIHSLSLKGVYLAFSNFVHIMPERYPFLVKM